MIGSLKLKALLGICLVHVGLALSLVGLLKDDGFQFSAPTFDLLLAGTLLMYASYIFSALSIWLQVRPWLSRIQYARAWRTWIFREIPTILALLPVALSVLKILRASWSEIKAFQDKGELNVQNLAGVAQKFATEAEALAKTPGMELVKKRLDEF